jgi:hypothetical protein
VTTHIFDGLDELIAEFENGEGATLILDAEGCDFAVGYRLIGGFPSGSGLLAHRVDPEVGRELLVLVVGHWIEPCGVDVAGVRVGLVIRLHLFEVATFLGERGAGHGCAIQGSVVSRAWSALTHPEL